MKMRHVSDPRNTRSATAAVEMALVAPLLIALLMGLLEVGRIVQVNQIMTNAAREGARSASTGINNYSTVQNTISYYLTQAGITNQSGMTVAITDVTAGGGSTSFDPSTASWLDQLQVTVTLPLSNVQLTSLKFLPTDPNTVITGQATWYSNQDQAYPSNSSITPPSGS